VTATAAQKKAQANAEAQAKYNAFLAVCPSRELLSRISDKWVVLTLAALRSDGSDPFGADCSGEPRPMRYSELSRMLVGVSQKMLTQTLRSLERDGLVRRVATPTVPVTVTYELTELGFSLHETVGRLKRWAEANMDDVFVNRTTYDTRPT
jgi:DNA-binding HxlR family transcriptional regulator